jgi:ubiquinone/menaquinone biosynthesis C-methylase UbiE
MNVLDIGCGPGYFSIEMAKMVGPDGRVISADLQEGMLRKLSAKISGSELQSRIRCILCGRSNINVSERVDFILAFYMVHEVPDKDSFFRQLNAVLIEHGRFLLVEPKLFHVSRKDFDATIKIAENAGFSAAPGPRLPFSWSAVLAKS